MISPELAQRLKQSPFNVVLTGGGSWLGQASLLVLENAFGSDLVSRVSVFGSHARPLRTPAGTQIESRALGEIKMLPEGSYLFLHYAFVTKSHVSEQPLVEYIRLNEAIADLVEETARRVGAKGFFLPSSGAVYCKDGSLQENVEASPYGFMKLKDELRFQRMCEEITCAYAPLRVFNVAGPCVNNVPAFVLSSIIDDVLHGMPVKLRATAPVFRSYVHVIDLIELVLSALLTSAWGVAEVFDTAGEDVIEVGDLARLITTLMGMPGYPIERPPLHNEPVDRYVGDRTAFARHADDLGITLRPLRSAILDTVADLKQRQGGGLKHE